mgnify:CR=1 FL=1|tara:strand:+ start:63 stop:548 length:486 start_codon:yes stop_codon:yes gene_type:complete
MNLKKGYLIILLIISFLVIINIKNRNKAYFRVFTIKTEKISLGTLLNYSFISGYLYSSILIFSSSIDKKSIQKDIKFEKININNQDANIDDDMKNKNINEEKNLNEQRPPERDIRETQPTISVNYRFVDQNNNFKSSKKDSEYNYSNNKSIDDWYEIENEW